MLFWKNEKINRHEIETLCTSGFGDRIYTQTESVSLFNVTQPNRSAISQHM